VPRPIVVRLLLARDGVDANAKHNDGWTPLILAAQNGHESVIRLLLAKAGVDANAKHKDGWTPLMLAAQNGHEAVVRLLLASDGVLFRSQRYFST